MRRPLLCPRRVLLVLGGDVDKELLYVPVEYGSQVGVNLQRKDGLVVTSTLDFSPDEHNIKEE